MTTLLAILLCAQAPEPRLNYETVAVPLSRVHVLTECILLFYLSGQESGRLLAPTSLIYSRGD
jgi:hypothetical protein